MSCPESLLRMWSDGYSVKFERTHIIQIILQFLVKEGRKGEYSFPLQTDRFVCLFSHV